jgi:hypothetical protein
MSRAIVRLMRARAPSLCLCLALTAPPLALATLTGDVHASVSIAVTWDGLLRESTASVVVTPIESRCAWESGRIYTYTRVSVDRVLAGEIAAGSEAWVRTMGGIVGKIGQIVEGEAVLAPGQSLLFVHAGPAGTLEVTARGQGQFPIVTGDAKTPARVVRSRATGGLVAPQIVVSSAATRLAADVLHGRFVDDVAGEVAAGWSRLHAHK